MAVQTETESVIYAKIGNPEGLQQAIKTIYQEQAQIRAPGGRIRVRMEREKGVEAYTYTLTTKRNQGGSEGLTSCREETVTIDAETYEMFKSVCDVFQRKIRFVFKVEKISISGGAFTGQLDVPDLNYEVDVFVREDKSLSTWAKIDVELDPLIEVLNNSGFKLDNGIDLKLKVSHLPFAPTAAFTESEDNPKGKELIGALFDNQFNRPVTTPGVATEAIAKQTKNASLRANLLASLTSNMK